VLFDVNARNVEALKVHGEQLAQLEKNFGRLMAKGHFSIHSFQEARAVTGIKGLNDRVSVL